MLITLTNTATNGIAAATRQTSAFNAIPARHCGWAAAGNCSAQP